MVPTSIIILLAQALAVQASIFSRNHVKSGDDINALCKGKKFDLSTFAQLKQLEGKLNSKCEQQTNQTVTRLMDIYEHNKDDLCTTSHVSELKSYYEWGLQTFLYPFGSDDEPKISVSFNRFAIAYGFQVSNMCKLNMLNALTGEQGQQKLAAMGPEARELFDKLTSDASPAGRLFGHMGNRDEPIMPGYLKAYLELHGINQIPLMKPGMRVHEATLNLIERIQSQCEQHYRPIYGPYMKPLVELAGMGMSYRDQELEIKLGNSAIAEEMGRWSRIAYTCTSLERFDFKKKHENEVLVEDTVAVAVALREVKKIGYEPATKVTLGEQTLIFDKSNKRLAEALKSAYFSSDTSYVVGKRMVRMTAEMSAKKMELGTIGKIVLGIQRGSLSWLLFDRCTDTGYLLEAIDQMNEWRAR